MAEDKTDESNPQADEPPVKEPILLNWLIMLAGFAGITLVTIWLTQ